jgi:1,4-dihydroxy-2-naphthoate octaprenyltransferase
MSAKAWISAARLRTLPLTLVCIGVGSSVAQAAGGFSVPIFLLTVLTAVLLQILSNFANDYGDFLKGTDNDDRVGPQRALQSGAIRQSQMKVALWLCGIAALGSGIGLLFYALNSLSEWFVFFVLGLFSILAAITYTVGKKAYGYNGLGDLMVFIFFGLVGVFGSYYLHTKVLDYTVFLPAISVGLFSTGVLNMNNTRDIENDKACGKITIPVRLGVSNAKMYQAFLIIGGLISTIVFFVLKFEVGNTVYMLWLSPCIVLFGFHLFGVFKEKSYRGFDKQLKICVACTLLFGISFAWICFGIT